MTSYGPEILMITGEYPPAQGGVGDYTALLSLHLQKGGARVTVATRGTQRIPDRGERPDGIAVLPVIPHWGVSSWSRLKSVIEQYGPRIVQIQYQAAAYAMQPAVHLLPAYLRFRLPRVRVVTTFHDLRVPYLFPKAGPLRSAALRAVDAASHATVVTNQADLVALGGATERGRCGRVRRRLIPIGSNLECCPPADFDRAAWRRQMGADDGTLLVSFFGFMNDSKGVEYLVQALGLLVGRGVPWRLLIVGGAPGESDPSNRGYSQRVIQLIKSRRLEDRVYWTGFIAGEQVSAALLSSDLCGLPFRDGVSLRRGSLLAALSHGLPVVTTAPQQTDPLFSQGENVVMVPRDSPSALADAVEQLWHDPAARERLASGARALARRFQWSDIAAAHLDMYENLLR